MFAGAVAAHGAFACRQLAATAAAQRSAIPVDMATGLLEHHAFRIRTEGEIARVRRERMTLTVCVVTVMSGDADQVGRLIADGLRAPEVGFRMAPRLFCILRSGVSTDIVVELRQRLTAATTRSEAAIGESYYPVDGATALELLHAAIARLR